MDKRVEKPTIIFNRKTEIVGIDCINGLIATGKVFNPRFFEDAGLYDIDIPEYEMEGKAVCTSCDNELRFEVLELKRKIS